MNKFDEILNKILTENELSMAGMDSTSEGYCDLNPLIMENLFFEAIDENEFPDLTPIPKIFLNYVCSKIKIKINSKLVISYKEIYDLLKDYEYKDVLDFKKGLSILKEYDSGYLCIGVCNYDLNSFNEIFSSNEMNEDRLRIFLIYVKILMQVIHFLETH